MGPWVGRAAVNESVCKQRGETWRSVFLEGITLAYWGNNLFPQYVSTLAVTSMLQPQTSATRIWAGHSSMTGSSAPDGQGRGLRVKAAPAISASDRASLLGVKLQASSFSFVAFLSPLFPLFPVTLSREEALECQVLKPQPVRLQDQHPQAQNSEKRGTASFPYYSGSPAPGTSDLHRFGLRSATLGPGSTAKAQEGLGFAHWRQIGLAWLAEERRGFKGRRLQDFGPESQGLIGQKDDEDPSKVQRQQITFVMYMLVTTRTDIPTAIWALTKSGKGAELLMDCTPASPPEALSQRLESARCAAWHCLK